MKGNAIVNFLGTLMVCIILFRCIQNESINLNGVISTAWDTVSDVFTATGSDRNYQPPSQTPQSPSSRQQRTTPVQQ